MRQPPLKGRGARNSSLDQKWRFVLEVPVAAAMHIRLRKHLSADKAYLAAKLYGRLESWYAQKEKIAFQKTRGLPWASLSTMCDLMGFKDHIGSRYLVMELKKVLDKSMLVHFWRKFEKGLRMADQLLILDKGKPKAKTYKDSEAADRNCQVYVVDEVEAFTWVGAGGPVIS